VITDVVFATPTEKTQNLIERYYANSEKVIKEKLSVQENEVRKYVLAEYVRLGTAPSLESIREKFQGDTDRILKKLDDYDFIYLDADKTYIQCSYPFSSKKTIHEVEIDGVHIYCNCAIDALGVPFMVNRDCTISSRCGLTGELLTIQMEDKKVVSRSHIDILVWFSFDRCGKSADSCCRKMLFFASSETLEKWVDTWSEKGERLTLPEALYISKYLFESFIV
jgi:hypothetical protein